MAARAFDPKEKELIQNLLLIKGREFFSVYGLKKTSIEDLTRAAGIAQGTFYKFYRSKEDLYFEIINGEEEELQAELLERLDSPTLTRTELKSLLLDALRLVDQNQILKRLYVGNEYELLLRKVSPEKIQAHIDRDTGSLLPLIGRLQQRGIMIERKPEAIAGLLRALFTVTLHRREIGEEHYQDTIDLLVELIARGLIIERENSND